MRRWISGKVIRTVQLFLSGWQFAASGLIRRVTLATIQASLPIAWDAALRFSL
jgi:hypothetical protein